MLKSLQRSDLLFDTSKQNSNEKVIIKGLNKQLFFKQLIYHFMKKIFLLFTMLITFSFIQKAVCQTNKSGVYLSLNDFTQNKLTYKSKHSYSKDDVYGYANAKNEKYRFYDKSSYKIVDTLSFFTYYQYKMEPGINGKGLVKTDEYYFSVKGDGPLLPLTINNLKKAFPENNKFHYALDALFKSDNELLAYDGYLKMYKLKYIYRSSCNNGETASIF